MKKLSLIIGLLALSLLIIPLDLVIAQVDTTIQDINNNPGDFVNENVQVDGLVIQYVAGSSTTVAHYILRDDMGAEIQVNTTIGPPETNVKYIVTGVVYHENRRLFISELSRQSMEAPTTQPPPAIAEADNTLTYILIALSVLVLLVILYFIYSRNEKQEDYLPSKDENKKTEDVFSTSKLDEDTHKTFLESGGENTIVIDRDYMTMKALPGKLVVLNGVQAEKKLSLFGAATSEGQAITIGRDSPDWKKHLKKGRENAHIRINDSTKTVSRLQAELILSNGEMKLRNLAQANPTIVDDKQLDVGETAELQKGSIIQAGNLKLQYEL